MPLTPCATCAELVGEGLCVCPHCGGRACARRELPAAAILLGLTLAACGGKDSASSTTLEPPYSVPVTDTADTATPATTQATEEEPR